jgi:hypothetical protein
MTIFRADVIVGAIGACAIVTLAQCQRNPEDPSVIPARLGSYALAPPDHSVIGASPW